MKQQFKKGIMGRVGAFLFLLIILGTGYYVAQHYGGANGVVHKYISYFQEKQYDKMYDLLDLSEMSKVYSREEIAACYKRLYEEEAQLVHMRLASAKKNKNYDNTTKQEEAIAYVYYTYEKGENMGKLELVKKDEKWLIKCPFVLSDLKVYAPIGSKVSIDGEEVKNYKERYYYKEQALPGKYNVKVEFPNGIYSDYIGIIQAPETTELFLDYTALTVEIKTIKGATIELAGIKQENTQGQAIFKNVLEGTYDLLIYHPDHAIEPIREKITITKQNRCFERMGAKLSATGLESLKRYITAFYQAYIESINTHSTAQLADYIGEENRTKLLNEFEDWFITNKNVADAKVMVQPKDITINKEGLLETRIVETTEIMNKEQDEFLGKEVERCYKILIEWQTQMDLSKEKWQVVDRKILQSIVCYKEEDGRWIQY